MRLNIRRRTAVATATGLPRYARNDKVGTPDDKAGTSEDKVVRVTTVARLTDRMGGYNITDIRRPQSVPLQGALCQTSIRLTH